MMENNSNIKTDSKNLSDPFLDEVKASRWSNLYFMKDGKSYKGIKEFMSAEDAEKYFYAVKNSGCNLELTLYGYLIIKNKELSYVIPMPVKD